jgi:cell wall-associated NlpC family hydrolase
MTGRLTNLAAVAVLSAVSLTGACASTGGTPRPFPAPTGPEDSDRQFHLATGHVAPRDVVETALTLRGVPYRDGGADLHGFDCSGFTQYVFRQFGIELPREVRDQIRTGKAVARTGIEAGDLIFFSTVSPGASHVGIAVGGDTFVHAPSTSGAVRLERLGSRYWSTRFVAGRRILTARPGVVARPRAPGAGRR